VRNRGIPAFVLALLLLAFYVLLYWTDLFTPFSKQVFGQSKWFLYGLLYTIAIVIGGIRFIYYKRKTRYHVLRTSVIIATQVLLAFLVPLFLKLLNQREYYFSYLWPLKIEYFYPQTIFKYPAPMVIYSFAVSLVLMPVLTYFFGKRWYCSWVCGCGGLANTFGDPWRHLSFKTLASWKFERISIHSVLVIAVITTLLAFADWGFGSDSQSFHAFAYQIRRWYGFFVGAMLAGVVGVGFYPLLGTRVWCRFFCPMAAALGIIQRTFSKFRITTNGPMCMECGLCSKYCEMGIDVRSYAQKGRDIKRASCVGCGICAWACPRGVLRLETK
jgi:polyferredoxin